MGVSTPGRRAPSGDLRAPVVRRFTFGITMDERDVEPVAFLHEEAKAILNAAPGRGDAQRIDGGQDELDAAFDAETRQVLAQRKVRGPVGQEDSPDHATSNSEIWAPGGDDR